MKNTKTKVNEDGIKIPNNVKKGKVNAKYNDEYTKATRKFPVFKTVLLVIVVAIQIFVLVKGLCYKPLPQDVIHQYDVTIEPLNDGSLDIEYHLVWEPLDPEEALTWVEIGMANQNFSVYPNTSSNIVSCQKYIDQYYVALELYFDKAYAAGEIIDFSFKINQKNMLCKNEEGYFYEFVPGWFNSIQVKNYKFTWYVNSSKNQVEQGSLDCGEYVKMNVQYGMNDFTGCDTVAYYEFDDEGAYNQLKEAKTDAIIGCLFVVIALLIIEVYLIDSHVSYRRGRGFLSGHGYYIHTYGRVNPYYVSARDRYNATHGGRGGGGGGCACACACACAGGGRAGCSQKDTYGIKSKKINYKNLNE